LRLACDIGGTFTDLSLLDERTGEVTLTKVPSTPPAFDDGVMDAISRAGAAGAEGIVHGSTIVINALAQRKGAKVALVTTKGFRDVLEIARTNRPDLYNLRYQKPTPFVPRHLVFEVTERTGHGGEVLTPLDEASVRAAGRALREEGVEAVAICLLHSYRRPDHEERTAEILREMLPGAYIAASSTVREWREYERATTAVMSAFVGPVVATYLDRLDARLDEAGIGAARSLTLSTGGRTSFAAARTWPVDLIESGPAAGVMGAVDMARRRGIESFVTLDVGGTTAKACLVENGEPLVRHEYPFETTRTSAGYPLLVTSLDLIEVGAGGGSIVQRRPDGSLTVGPESAGADPGPACYGKGGDRPTVADALVLTGRLGTRLAHGFTLSRDLAGQAFDALASSLGTSVREAAVGTLRLAEATMAHILALSTASRGRDPRDFSLVAYGGEGPMHATALARELGFKEVVIPPRPGVFTAESMLRSPWRLDLRRTLWSRFPEGWDEVTQALAALEDEARAWVAREGIRGQARMIPGVLCRYTGQTHSLEVPLGDLDELPQAFRNEHRRLYDFTLDQPFEITAIHLACVVPSESVSLLEDPAEEVRPALRTVWTEAGSREVPVWPRAALGERASIRGPAIIEEETATTFLLEGASLEVLDGCLVISPGKEEA